MIPAVTFLLAIALWFTVIAPMWSPLWFKIMWIKRRLRREVRGYIKEDFWIHWYGAYWIDPKHVVYWICVKSDLQKDKLVNDMDLAGRLRSLLNEANYPSSAIASVHIVFESQETVDRESNGSWYIHWK
jgi:hypothetical protein